MFYLKIKEISIGFILVLCSISLVSAASPVKKNEEGAELYKMDKYEEALSDFRDAQLDLPDSPELNHNIGISLYKQKRYDKATEEFVKGLQYAKDPLVESKLYYNIGNCFFKQDSLLQSIQLYKKALELNPDDQDAKYNLELARALLKELSEKQEQPQQQQQQQQDQEEQQNQNQEQQQQQQDQEQEQEEQQAQQQQGDEDQDEEDKEEQGQPQPQEKEISKEEAERILNALKDEDKEMQEEKMKKRAGGKSYHEKDW